MQAELFMQTAFKYGNCCRFFKGFYACNEKHIDQNYNSAVLKTSYKQYLEHWFKQITTVWTNQNGRLISERHISNIILK